MVGVGLTDATIATRGDHAEAFVASVALVAAPDIRRRLSEAVPRATAWISGFIGAAMTTGDIR